MSTEPPLNLNTQEHRDALKWTCFVRRYRASQYCRRGCTVSLVLAAMAISSACRGAAMPASPDQPTQGVYAGTWTGTMVDDKGGSAAAQVVIEDALGFIHGTWTATFPDSATPVTGIIDSSHTSLPSFLLCCTSNGGLVTSTMTLADTHLAGEYRATFCSDLSKGTINLVKQ
jgi:hypothetical protein